MSNPNLSIPQDHIADFCRRHHIRKLSLFGSVLRDDFGPDSDVDVLVEFEPGHVPGLIIGQHLYACSNSRPISSIKKGRLGC